MRLLLIFGFGFLAASAIGLAQPQPLRSFAAAPQACSLSGQSPEQGSFDPDEFEFVSNPTPFSIGGKQFEVSFSFIARVVNLRPLFLETLSSATSMPPPKDASVAAPRPCDIMRILDVHTKLRDVLPRLRFNDLVAGRAMFGNAGLSKSVLMELSKITGAPPSLPDTPTHACSNRAGTLVDYRAFGKGEVLLTNDLSIYYSNPRGETFDQEKLSQEDLNRLMRSFADAGFDQFPARRWSTNDQNQRPTLTLICSRTQSVLVEDHLQALAPVLQNLDRLKAAALANASLVLSWRERVPITFVEWPLANLALDQVENLKHSAANAAYEAQRLHQPAPDFPALRQQLPADFLGKLPSSGSPETETIFVRSGSEIFWVNRILKPPPANEGTIRAIQVQQLETPENARVSSYLSGLLDQTGQPIDLNCGLLQNFVPLIWPGAGETQLSENPAGRRVSREEYARHSALYDKIYNNCGAGINLIQGDYLYRDVQLKYVETSPR